MTSQAMQTDHVTAAMQMIAQNTLYRITDFCNYVQEKHTITCRIGFDIPACRWGATMQRGGASIQIIGCYSIDELMKDCGSAVGKLYAKSSDHDEEIDQLRKRLASKQQALEAIIKKDERIESPSDTLCSIVVIAQEASDI